MSLFLGIISFASIKAVATFTFLIIIFLCFLRNALFRDNIDNRGTQKIIGGLSVFVVAILSDNGYVYLTSLFIGGLIIASEEFMEKLAIILRSRSEDIGENLKYSKATSNEIEKKQEDEAITVQKFKNRLKERLKETQEALEEAKKKINTSTFLIKIKSAEKLVTSYLIDKYGESFHPQVKVVTKIKDTNLVVDGLLTDKDNTITTIFEIKYLSSLAIGRIIVRRTLEHLRFYFRNERIVICIVGESFSKKQIIEIKKFSEQFENMEILFFKIDNNKILQIQ